MRNAGAWWIWRSVSRMAANTPQQITSPMHPATFLVSGKARSLAARPANEREHGKCSARKGLCVVCVCC